MHYRHNKSLVILYGSFHALQIEIIEIEGKKKEQERQEERRNRKGDDKRDNGVREERTGKRK